MSALDEASERLSQAAERLRGLHVKWREVNEEVDRAEAEVFRLSLLDKIDNPQPGQATTWSGQEIDLSKLVGLSYEVQAEYDDEGRYPLCVSITWQWKEGINEDEIDPWDVIEDRPTPEVMALICESSSEWDGRTTIARLREISFANPGSRIETDAGVESHPGKQCVACGEEFPPGFTEVRLSDNPPGWRHWPNCP